MTKVAVIGAFAPSLVGFRGPLLRGMARRGLEVDALAAFESNETVRAIESLGARFVPIPVRRTGLNPTQDLRTLLFLRQYYKDARPDIVLPYTVKPIVWGSLAAFGERRIKLVPIVTGLGYAFDGSSAQRRALRALVSGLYSLALRRADAVVFQNTDDLEHFRTAGIFDRSEVAHVIEGSGVDVARFAPRPIPPGPPVFLCIARLLRAKGLAEYAQAAAAVRARRPDVRFRLVGPVDESPDGLSPADVTCNGAVEYVGPVSDVRGELANCHVFVLPSYREGLPRSVIEAMSTGRPVVTTRVPGCAATVDDGVNGWLVDARSATSLAQGIFRALDAEAHWGSIGEANRIRAERRFSDTMVTERMFDILGV